MKIRNMKINKILLFLILGFINFAQGQDLKLFSPIVISNLPNDIINNEKVNKVILDYYNPEANKMELSFLKYSSDDNVLYLFDSEKKGFKPFIYFNKIGKNVSTENFLGIFRYFDLTQESERCFKASSASGNYPSHFEKIDSIEVLEKDKRFLIIKINYSDIYDFKGYGVLVLQDYKHTIKSN
ncbi:hypothetical protein ATE47_12340 [Chryseobacterium sp. IHB B 17019]|nr:hypothetical protein ATE47_12340 [Chryseobacterium sp. IHB B 17019]